MRILGIDPALSITGYGLIEVSGTSFRILEAGIIETAQKEDLPARLGKIYVAVGSILKEFRPGVAVLEKIYSHYAHPATSCVLGHARGVICLACSTAGISVAEYAATRIKKAIVGKGLASKQQVQRMVVDLLGLKETPAYMDITDALALAIGHYFIGKSKI